MDQLKQTVMALNQAEIQHLMTYIQQNRNDVLFVFGMTKQALLMDEAHLKEFKAWLTDNGFLDEMVAAVLRDTVGKLDAVVEHNSDGEDSIKTECDGTQPLNDGLDTGAGSGGSNAAPGYVNCVGR
jgi:hypothetical protein